MWWNNSLDLSDNPLEEKFVRACISEFIGTNEPIGILMTKNSVTLPSRARVAGLRAKTARVRLEHCEFCTHRCGVDRSKKAAGQCHAGPKARVFLAQTEVSDELLFIPTFSIALSGCNLRCAFCITAKESWNSRAGKFVEPKTLAQDAVEALERGARSIMVLGGEPTLHLPDIFDFIAALPDEAKLIWKTNAYISPQGRELLDGLFDTWIVDYKFGNDACAERLARVSNYIDTVRENLIWASTRTELVVRHLLMPGHVHCWWEPVARWVAENLPGVKVNLRAGFWPMWKSNKYPELMKPAEENSGLEIARDYHLNLIE